MPPPCLNCNSLLRPDVVWFGENMLQETLAQASLVSKTCDTLLSIGTSSTVEPAKSLPFMTKQVEAVLIEINPAHTPLTHSVDFALNGSAGTVLPEIISYIKERVVINHRFRLSPHLAHGDYDTIFPAKDSVVLYASAVIPNSIPRTRGWTWGVFRVIWRELLVPNAIFLRTTPKSSGDVTWAN